METNEWKDDFIKRFVISKEIGTGTIQSTIRGFGDGRNEDGSFPIKNGELQYIPDQVIDYISQNFISISELKRWVEENEAEEDEQGLWQAPNRIMSKDIAAAHNSALKALKDKFIPDEI